MIIGEIYIRKEDINKNIKIINSYDNYFREKRDYKDENQKIK